MARMHPLKVARKDHGLSLCQVAIHVGLPANKSGTSQVNRWEKGACILRLDRAERLSQVLGFASGEQVQRICQEWRGPRKRRKQPENPPQNRGSREPHPLSLRHKMHPIKEYRKICGLSLRELAEKLGFSGSNEKSGPTRIAHWERGACVPRYDRAEKLAGILGFESAEEVVQKCQEWRDSKR